MAEYMNIGKKRQLAKKLEQQQIDDVGEKISEAIEGRLTVLTAVINEASITNTLVGLGLLVMGAATWAIFFMEIGKLVVGSKFLEAGFGVVGAVVTVVIVYAFKRTLFSGNNKGV